MTRKEKITALQAIKEGKATIESLQQPQRYYFEEDNHLPGIYVMSGKEYSVDEYFAFRESKKSTSDTIISITKHQQCRIKGNITMNIE